MEHRSPINTQFVTYNAALGRYMPKPTQAAPITGAMSGHGSGAPLVRCQLIRCRSCGRWTDGLAHCKPCLNGRSH
jgi:hypothetical protein